MNIQRVALRARDIVRKRGFVVSYVSGKSLRQCFDLCVSAAIVHAGSMKGKIVMDEDVPLRDPNMLNLVSEVSTRLSPSFDLHLLCAQAVHIITELKTLWFWLVYTRYLRCHRLTQRGMVGQGAQDVRQRRRAHYGHRLRHQVQYHPFAGLQGHQGSRALQILLNQAASASSDGLSLPTSLAVDGCAVELGHQKGAIRRSLHLQWPR
jgi:hypothetical protein